MALFACNNSSDLKTVEKIDLEKYQGKWYEIANYPTKFQKGCKCTTAEYSLTEKGYVEVVNTCFRDNKISNIKGKAFVVKNTNNTKLKVQFFWPFRGDYWIIDIADDYSYAVVSNPNKKYLWILSRAPVMDENLYSEILKKLENKGFDTLKLVKTEQTCK